MIFVRFGGICTENQWRGNTLSDLSISAIPSVDGMKDHKKDHK